jgi:hypothetical protein
MCVCVWRRGGGEYACTHAYVHRVIIVFKIFKVDVTFDRNKLLNMDIGVLELSKCINAKEYKQLITQ